MAAERTFKSIEHDGWNERATIYDKYTARITNYGIEPLLESARIEPGNTVLDVCCGTGLVAAVAASRGAIVTGVDIAEDMVNTAIKKRLAAEFRTGDAEHLPFKDDSFDFVICNFGMYHLPEPDHAVREAARVLKRGGRYAYTTWCGPEVSPLYRIIPEAIKTYGTMDVGLPSAPPAFRFADRAEATKAMQDAGFSEITFGDIPAVLDCPIEGVLDFIEHAFVRATMMLHAQPAQARPRVLQAIQKQFSKYAVGGIVQMPLPAVSSAARSDEKDDTIRGAPPRQPSAPAGATVRPAVKPSWVSA